MDRWLFTFFIGSILSLFMPVVPVFFCVVLYISLGVVCLLNKTTKIISGLFFGSAWLLFCSLQYNDSWTNNRVDLSSIVKAPHLITGIVESIPTSKISDLLINHKFNFRIESIDGEILTQSMLIRLSWNKAQAALFQGEKWTFNVKLKPPHGFVNSGGFSYQTWLRQNSIVATGYVIPNHINEKLASNISRRQVLYNKAITLLPNHQLSPLLIALSFGERSKLRSEHWDVLQRTNTQHLIAISGLHLGLIATSSFFFFTFIFRQFSTVLINPKILTYLPFINVQRYNIRLLAVFFSCGITFYYAFLAGFTLPTLRALVMLLVFWCVRLLGLHWSLTRWLLFSVFIVIVITPFSLFSASFWLSFYAVSLIFLTVWRFKSQFTGNNKFTTWIRSLLGVQICLSFFMLPISMLFNYQISLASVAANIVAVPFMSVTTIPLSLLSVIVMPIHEASSSFLYEVALFNLDVLWSWLTYLSNQSWSTVSVSLSFIVMSSIFIATVSWFCFTSVNKKYIGGVSVFLISMFLFLPLYLSNTEEWKVTVLDVGQGLSVIIEKEGRAILYDTGARYPSGFNMVDTVILPYLKNKGINRLDKVIISHSDNDHAGGLSILRKSLPIIQIIANDPKLKGDKSCLQGDSFTWNDLNFSAVWPNREYEDDLKNLGDDNDDSCVIRVSDGNQSVLLTGDISKKVESILVHDKQLLSLLNSDVIIAPHHGSNTSSTDLFIEGVSPEYVVFSAGFNNRWNMPSKYVQRRYEKHEVKAYNTAEHGMIEIVFKSNVEGGTVDKNIDLITYRQNKWPFWFAN